MNFSKKILILCWLIFLSCAYYNTFYNANKYYREALSKQKANPSLAKTNFEKTIEKSALVISKYPRSKYTPQALFMIGVCYYYLGEYSKAMAKFENLSLVFPQSKYIDEANLYWAYCLIATNDYNSALEKLQAIKLSQSKTLSRAQYESALLKLGELYYLLGDYVSAANELNNFIVKYPKSPLLLNALILLGDVQKTQQNYEQAILTYKQYLDKIGLKRLQSTTAISDTSGYVPVSLRLAECYIETNRMSEATNILEEIIQSDTLKSRSLFDSKTYLNLGKLYLKTNNVEKAQTYLRKINNVRDLAEGYYLLGNSYESQGKFDTAKAYYDSIVIKKLQSEWMTLAQSRSMLLSLVISEPKPPSKQSTTKKDSLAKSLQTVDTLYEKGFEGAINNDTMEHIDTLISKKIQKDTLQPRVILDTISPLDLAERQFHLAEVYNLNLKKYEQALIEYEKVYTQYPKSPFAPKALFAMLWIYKNIMKADVDSSTYHQDFGRVLNKIVTDYPNTEYAKAAKELLLEK
ncbi:MAG: tetratricopeptide repeat protein [candidate division WOR-3 bacterium]|nr:tetratricopeptide repeat protein [candidate division WOR-3 bacterium]